ncbi:MAG: NAD-dependent epimerase/dehydratase family protein [Gemmatimonadales bacterium]|jgi:UDP-glucose 4-epimerase|nr:NAD-dependent epimerase/dehydratase family protein [Gemmatimonadales bacterium]
MKVLITGGAGFIGANLARTLTSGRTDIDDVIVIDDLSFGLRSNLDGLDVNFIEGSILDEDLLATAMDGVSSVVHLAARSSVPRSIAEPMAAHADNATGTALVLEAARTEGDVQVIVASSSSVYGANDVLPKHEGLAPRPVSPYAASKLATESYTLAWGHSYDMSVLALRFFNVFGPLQPPLHTYAAVIPAFLSAAMQGQPLPVHGDGTQCRDFTYVDTVVSVIVDAIQRRVSHLEPLNLAFGQKITLLEVISELEVILDRKLPVDFQPSRVGDVARSQADSSALRRLFPDITPSDFADGLRATAGWFQSTRPWDQGVD